MTDPAIEAVKRAWAGCPNDGREHDVSLVAAREALKPIRELHFRTMAKGVGAICANCGHYWPCETARLIYTTEELES